MQAAPPPFIAPPTQPQIVGYVPQAQAPFVPGFQGQFNPVVCLYNLVVLSLNFRHFQAPPTELYQPQGGITYYSADQQVAPRQVPQKRPKAAIPIVAPTDFKEETANEAPPPEANEWDWLLVYVGVTERGDSQSWAKPSQVWLYCCNTHVFFWLCRKLLSVGTMLSCYLSK